MTFSVLNNFSKRDFLNFFRFFFSGVSFWWKWATLTKILKSNLFILLQQLQNVVRYGYDLSVNCQLCQKIILVSQSQQWKAAHLNSSLNFLTLICYLQDDKAAELVSNVALIKENPVKTATNVIGGTGNINRKPDSSEIDDFDDVTNKELLAAIAEAEAQIGLGEPNPYPKSKEDSVTGEKKNKVPILTFQATTLKITTLFAMLSFNCI